MLLLSKRYWTGDESDGHSSLASVQQGLQALGAWQLGSIITAQTGVPGDVLGLGSADPWAFPSLVPGCNPLRQISKVTRMGLSTTTRSALRSRCRHTVTRRACIHQGRFAGSGARRRIDDHWAACLEDRAYAFQDFFAQFREFGTSVVDDRMVHSPENAIRRVGRTGDLKKVATRMNHGNLRESTPRRSRPRRSLTQRTQRKLGRGKGQPISSCQLVQAGGIVPSSSRQSSNQGLKSTHDP